IPLIPRLFPWRGRLPPAVRQRKETLRAGTSVALCGGPWDAVAVLRDELSACGFDLSSGRAGLFLSAHPEERLRSSKTHLEGRHGTHPRYGEDHPARSSSISSAVTLAPATTPGMPAPGWVPAPTRYMFSSTSS